MVLNRYQFGKLSLGAEPSGRLDLLLSDLKAEFPLLQMEFKSSCWYWRVLHWLIFLVTFGQNRSFCSVYTTTIGNRIAWPDDLVAVMGKPQWEDQFWTILCHEREHLKQFNRYGVLLMFFLYVILPLPIGLSYFRMKFERAGYLKTLECWYQLDREYAESERARQWWVKQFIGPNYGWCWPFKWAVMGWYDRKLLQLMDQG